MKTISAVEDRGQPSARALWHVGPRVSAIRQEVVSPPAAGEVMVRALYSAISRGTERLVWRGAVPAAEAQSMRAPFQAGEFAYPVKYGYCAVGEVVAGASEWIGRQVFALHPHQDLFVVPVQAVTALPPQVPARRAVLGANVETALNALWDGAAAPGMRIAIVGAGTIGGLVAWLAGRLPGCEVTLVDIAPGRQSLAAALGVGWAPPEAAPRDCDLVFHASASAGGLDTALGCAGDEARVVELSWYGSQRVEAPLGAAFHSRRLSLVSSQVGRVAPAMRPRWTHARRLAAALSLLADPTPEALLAPDTPFDQLPDRIASLLEGPASAPCPVVAYPALRLPFLSPSPRAPMPAP